MPFVWKTHLEKAVDCLEKNKSDCLILTKSKIDDDGAKTLAKHLKTNTKVTTLCLENNKIGSEGAMALADALKTNTVVTTVHLDDNNIGDKGAMALADALKTNTVVTTLYLFRTNIGSEGAMALADALKTNTKLTTLNLDSNKIGNECAKVLAGALEKNTTLTKLNLFNNKIGNEGARAFADALKKNTALEYLDLDLNEITEESNKAYIKALLKRNRKKGDEWKQVVALREAEAIPKQKLPEDKKTILAEEEGRKMQEAEAKKQAKPEAEAKRKAEAEAEEKKKHEEERKIQEAEAKRKAEVAKQLIEEAEREAKGNTEESQKPNDEPVPIVDPEDCKVMISFNDDSAGPDAEKLANYLTSNGQPTFCTRLYCPLHSGSWREATVAGVDTCKYYVILMTNGWQKSNECQYETEIAINRKANREVTLIPVRYNDFDEVFDKKGGLDNKGNPVKGKRYGNQFLGIQAIYRNKSLDWMQDILKLLKK